MQDGLSPRSLREDYLVISCRPCWKRASNHPEMMGVDKGAVCKSMVWVGRRLWGWYRLWSLTKDDLAPGMQTVEWRITSTTPRTWSLCRVTRDPTGKQIPSARVHSHLSSPKDSSMDTRGISRGLGSMARGKMGWFGEQTDKAHRHAPPLGALGFLLKGVHTLSKAPGSHSPHFQCPSGIGI